MPTTRLHGICWLLAGLPVLLAGCAGQTGSLGGVNRSALSQKIEFASQYNIEKATATVMEMDGFALVHREPGMFLFERDGDAATREHYGDWFGPGVRARFEIGIRELEFGTHEVQLTARARDGQSWLLVPGESAPLRGVLKRIKKLARAL